MEIKKSRLITLTVLIASLLVFSSMTIAFTGGSSIISEEEQSVPGDEVAIIYTGGQPSGSLLNDVSVLEEYENFMLVKTSEKRLSTLKDEGKFLKKPGEKLYTPGGNFDFSETLKDKDWNIDSYSGDEGLYLVNFIGPIKQSWKDEINKLDGEFYGSPGDAYLVKIDPQNVGDLKDFDHVKGVKPYHPRYKLEDDVYDKIVNGEIKEKITLDIRMTDEMDKKQLKKTLVEMDGTLLTFSERAVNANNAQIILDSSDINEFAKKIDVLNIYKDRKFHLFNDDASWVLQSFDTTPDHATPLWDHGIYGQNQVVAASDTGIDYDHAMFRNSTNSVGSPGPSHRKVIYYNAYADDQDTDNSGHGTHVTGSIAGDWETYGEPDDHDGMAPAADISFYDIGNSDGSLSTPNDLTTMFQDQYDTGARIFSNSWGSSDSSYSTNAGDCDTFMWNHEDALILFANGNDGPDPNTVGEPATAKSIVSVGAAVHEDSEDMTDFSSRGPTDDGRQKPTIVAPGESIVSADSDGDLSTLNNGLLSMQGTSMATPLTAGITALARQYYTEGWYPGGQENSGPGFSPSGSLLKATLINSAWNMEGYGTNGSIPSIGQGWGKVNLDNTLHFEDDDRKMKILNSSSGFSSSGTEHSYNVYSGDDQRLKVTLTWTDYPDGNGPINNDLDLVVEAPDGTTYYGNNFVDGTSASGGSADSTEPHEQVLLDLPDMQEGKYTVRVLSSTLESGPQKYALLATGDIVDSRGSVRFEHDKYNIPPVNDFVDVRVSDSDLNTDPNTQESVDVTVSSTTESSGETWTLTETGTDTGIFNTSIQLDTSDPATDGILQVSKGDTLTAEYTDSSHSTTRTAYAEIDATAPQISEVKHPSIPQNRLVVDAASVEWVTDEESYGRLDYGKTPELGQRTIEENASYNHTLVMKDLDPNTTYYYRLVSTDLSHGPNVGIDDNDGALYTFRTPNWPMEMGVGNTGYVYDISGSTAGIFDRDVSWGGYYYYQAFGPADEGPFEAIYMFNSSHIAGRSLDSAKLHLFNNAMYRNTAGTETWRFQVLPDSVESTFPNPTYADVSSANVGAQFEMGTKTTTELAGAGEADVVDFSGNVADLENNMADGKVVVRVVGDFTKSEYFLNSWFSGHNTTKDTWHLKNPQIRVNFNSPSTGDVTFDKAKYGVSDFAHIYLDDEDLNTDPNTEETAQVTVTSQTTGDSEDLTLTETTANSSKFHNKIEIASGSASSNDGLLQVQAGETIEVSYSDANPSGTRTDTAVIDGTAPTISNVASSVNGVDATITWDTDEDSTSKVYYGGTTSLGAEEFDENLVTGHSIDLTGLAENTQYYFKVESTDISGNTAVDDNSGSLYTFTTGTGTVTDSEGPAVGNLSYSPSQPEWGTTTTFEGIADDTVAGGSNVDAVEYFFDKIGNDGEGNAMSPTDGAFDSSIEEFTTDVQTEELSTGTHVLYVHALDTSGNWGTFSDITFNVTSSTTQNSAPSVDLTRPDGGETFTEGDVETIWWNMSDSEDANTDLTVDLYYSNDSGSSWNTIATGIAGDADPNTYDWTVPNDPTTNALVRVDVTDTNGSTTSDQSASTFTIQSSNNPPNEPTNPSPADGATGVSTDPTLSVDVSDPDGDQMDVSFYNGSDDSLIGTDAGVADGGTASVTWSGLAYNTTYYWYAVADDGSATNTSSTWSFTTQTQTVSDVYIYPDTDQTVQAGEELTFDAEAYDQDGNLITDDPTDFIWENATDGVFYETNTGDYEVTATYDGVTSNITMVTVEPADAQSIELTPQTTNITAGNSQAYNATAYDEWGNAFDVTANTSWSDDVSAGNSSWTDNVITVEEAGDWNVTGEYQNATGSLLTDTANLTVEPAAVDSVVIYPETDQTVQVGDSLLFDSEAYDSYGNLITDNVDEFTWENASNGVFYETVAGVYEVTATYNGVTSPITNVTVNPYNLTIDSTAGGNVTQPGEGTFQYNHSEVVNLTAVADQDYKFVEWTGDNGTITDTTANETTIEMLDNYTITANFEATQVSYVYIYPDTDQTVQAGEELIFDAEAYDQDGNLITDDPTDFTWENATDGVFYETNTADYDVTATYDGVTSNITTVTVEPADAVSIELTPQTSNITAGNSQAYNATAYDEWGNAFDVTANTSWSDDVSAGNSSWTDNVITVEEAGDWNVTGEYQNATGTILTDNASLTVNPASVDSVVIYPDTDQVVEAGQELLFDAEAYDSYGNLITDNVDDFTWENASNGVFYETTAGEYDVTATYNGVTSNITTVTVEPAAVDYVVIDPAENQTIMTGDQLNFTAAAYDQYGNLITDDVTNFTWENISSIDDQNNVAVFSIETSGDYEVTATYNNTSNATTVTVLPFTLDISSTAGGNATVPGEGTFEYDNGTIVDLEAVADTGYHFVRWSGDNGTIDDTTANATTIEMLANYTITAEFAINTYTLDVSSTSGGNVTLPGEGTFTYNHGTIVDLEAIADTGYHFVEWTGDNGTIGDVTANQTTIEMLDNYTITAEFAINTYTLDLSSTTGGNVTNPGEGTFTYDHGITVDLEAVADTGYQFLEWTGDNGTINDTTANQTTITMEGDYVVTAEFEQTADLVPPTGLQVVKNGGDIEVLWDDVGAPEYNVYYSTDQYAEFANWTELATVTDTNYIHTGALGGENYYIVRSSDGTDESGNSTMGFSVERHFVDDDDDDLHYVSIPARLNNTENLNASDIVVDIEGSLNTNDKIYRVVKWDYTVRGYTQEFYYNDLEGQWSSGEDFGIEPGDGIGIMIQDGADFNWNLNGVDTNFTMSFVDDDDDDLHYISLPYTFADYTNDGQLNASDVVTAIEGSLNTNDKIYRVVKWDYTVRGYTQEFYYNDLEGQWSSGEDFGIEPGDGIGIMIQDGADFNWNMELVTPYRGEGNSTSSVNHNLQRSPSTTPTYQALSAKRQNTQLSQIQKLESTTNLSKTLLSKSLLLKNFDTHGIKN